MSNTYCRDCRNVHQDTRGGDPWTWRCVKAPIPAGYGYVDPDFSPNPPFARCDRTNLNGNCPYFEALPEPNESETPKTKEYERHRREMKRHATGV